MLVEIQAFYSKKADFIRPRTYKTVAAFFGIDVPSIQTRWYT